MGRKHERIPIFLKLVDWSKFVYDLSNEGEFVKNSSKINLLHSKIHLITYEWTINPDLRIGQLLINMKILPNDIKLWHTDCNDILEQQGINPAKYTLWGTYGKEKEAKRKFESWKKKYINFGLSKKESKRFLEKDSILLASLLSNDTKKIKKLNSLHTRLNAWNRIKPMPIYKPVCDLTTEHIVAILDTQKLSFKIEFILQEELKLRADD